MLFSDEHWQVSVFQWPEGALECAAEVTDGEEAFAIWVDVEGGVQLQFFSPEWDFAVGQVDDLEVQIDAESPWSLGAAPLNESSIWFKLPDTEAGVNIIAEVAAGNQLALRWADGSDMRNYSLAGSAASIAALIDCGTLRRWGRTRRSTRRL